MNIQQGLVALIASAGLASSALASLPAEMPLMACSNALTQDYTTVAATEFA